MELKQLAVVPTLTKVTVDKPIVVEAYGEPIEFWMYDRQDLPTYLKLAQLNGDNDAIFEIIKDVVLDADGNRVLDNGAQLPLDIMIPVLECAVAQLGNTVPLTSAQ